MRVAQLDDLESIGRLLDLAFAPSRFESRLVRAMMENQRSIHHWIIEHGQEPLAYVCYSLAYRGREPIGWHLAPVAVDPNWQRQGLGSSLIRATLAQSPLFSCPVFALGDPAYYQRFGFSAASEFGLECAIPVPVEVFLAAELAPGALAGCSGVVSYRPEFDAVSA